MLEQVQANLAVPKDLSIFHRRGRRAQSYINTHPPMSTFWERARGLAAAAASASDAGWRVVDGGRDDAASHAAAKQLANAAAFLDVERAVDRVFGSSSAEGEGWFVF